MNFSSFGFSQSIMQGIEAIGYETPTPIQLQAVPAIMQGSDLIASAQTGTGKTAAFLLPLIQKMSEAEQHDHIKALVIVPTRELAQQIDQQMEGFSYFTPISSIPIYGGTDGTVFSRERQALIDGADMIICTPGRLIAHLNMGYVKFPDLKFLVLDEADRMLDMGFFDDIMKIVDYLPAKRQNLLFSATMPPAIRQLARKILHEPLEISIAPSKPADKVKQHAYLVYDNQKIRLVETLLEQKEFKSVLIFCSTKEKTKNLARELKKIKLKAGEIHSDIDQAAREDVLNRFKSRDLPILVATDILSRGIDIDDIDLVINYDVPHDAEDYVHRVGRTARAEAEGEAITLVNETDQRRLAAIENLIGYEIEKPALPENLGQGPAYNPLRQKTFKPKGNRPKRNFAGKGKQSRQR